MIPARLLNRTLTWMQPSTTTNVYGDTVPTATGTGTTITGRIDQTSTAETQDETRDLSTSLLTLFTNTIGLSALDLIIDGSTTYEVDGWPAVIDTPSGAHHTEARLRLVASS